MHCRLYKREGESEIERTAVCVSKRENLKLIWLSSNTVLLCAHDARRHRVQGSRPPSACRADCAEEHAGGACGHAFGESTAAAELILL